MAHSRFSWLARFVGVFLALVLTSPAWSQDDPPGRVGRLAEFQGGVLWFDHEQGQWVQAERNRPVTGGDRLSTAPEGRVELRVGSTVLRLGAQSELEVLRLDDERLGFQLHSGSLALRVRSREVAGEIDIVTAEARFQPQRSGHYRFDRIDDTTQAGSWLGDLLVEGRAGFVIATGQRAELWRQGPRGELRQVWTAPTDDAFSRWVARDDSRDERTASSRFVSPEMTGAEDLDRAGRWDRHPDFGAIWFPIEVRPGWAPYRYGRWAWVRPWGWTWVDEAPWGFAPFHYGRWLSWNGRWGWVPGAYVPRPVYAPGLVAWVGGPSGGVSVNPRGPVVGWLPLAPREVFVPSYQHTPRHRDRINDLPHGAASGPPRPPQEREPREPRGAPPAPVPSPTPGQEAPRPPGDMMVGAPRPRTDAPVQVDPRRDRGGRGGDRGEAVERFDRPDRGDRPGRPDRPERVERAGPPMPVAPAAPVMGPRPVTPVPPAAPQATPPPAPAPAPQVMGPARPAAPPAAVPPRPPATPGERERSRERDAPAGEGERQRGNSANRGTEAQR